MDFRAVPFRVPCQYGSGHGPLCPFAGPSKMARNGGSARPAKSSLYDSVLLTNVLLLELPRKVALHEGRLAGTAISDENKLKMKAI